MKPCIRKLTAVLLFGMLLTACSGEPAAEDAPQVVLASAQPAPESLNRPGPEAFRVATALTIQTARDAWIYSGRGRWYLPVAELPAGTQVQYLASREGWFEVQTATGETGWLGSSDAEVGDGRNQAVRYRIGSGRWELQAEPGPQIALKRITSGVMQMVVTEIGARPEIQELREGSLLLAGSVPGGIQGALDIGDAGDLHPVLRQEGSDLVVDLPGTVLTADFPGAPAGIRLAEVAPEPSADGSPQPASLTAAVPGRMPAGGLRLRLIAPNTPYRLYRSSPARLELRFLPSGLKGKTIVLDPGHGGEETGAVGVRGNLEKDVNLAVALMLKPMLEQAGAQQAAAGALFRAIRTYHGDKRKSQGS